MANGDLADAKGWIIVPPTDDVRVGYDDINYAMDRTAEVLDIATEGLDEKFDAAKIIITTSTPAVVNGALWAKPLS